MLEDEKRSVMFLQSPREDVDKGCNLRPRRRGAARRVELDRPYRF